MRTNLTKPHAFSAALLLLSVLAPAHAAEPPAAAPAAPQAAIHPRWDLFGSWRVREEYWNWFNTPAADNRYAFTGSLLRVGALRAGPREDLMLELAAPAFIDLPHGASALPPQGQLGLGAAYNDANAGQDASLFVKQAYWRGKNVGAKGNSLLIGRSEFIEGLEAMPKDATLGWLKRERVAHRMIGNFGWSHVQRSFDGGVFRRTTPGGELTVMGGIPTRGVFDLNGMDTLPDVRIGYAAFTHPFTHGKTTGEGRVFGVYYDDSREVVKTDNRDLAVRATDFDPIRIGSLGGHLAAVRETGGGKWDGLLWAGGQFGKWGSQDHLAYQVDAEVGYQPKHAPLNAWLRAGFLQSSGDGSPGNDQHGTWMPMLPTPRVYARFPFFTQMNLNDAFLQALLRPSPKLTVRTDVHWLSLADRADLWYSGGGAFQDRPSFGYAGRPSGGQSDLATLYDVSFDYQWRKNTAFTLYVGYAAGGDVVRSTFSGTDGLLGYLELNQRF